MANRFLLTEYAHSWIDASLYIACTSDVPCHIFLRWTDVEERIHLRSEIDRGLAKLGDPKYCFVQYNEVEQNEAGDTLSHTFNFTGWAPCVRRWWMFRATIGGQDSPSNTCIFSAHCPDQEKADSLRHPDLVEKEVAGVIDHADASVTKEKLASSGITWHDAGTRVLWVPGQTGTTGWTLLNLTGWVPEGSKFAYLNLYIFVNVINPATYAILTVKKPGTTPSHSPRALANYNNGMLVNGWVEARAWVALDAQLRFEWNAILTAGINTDLAIHLLASAL